MSRIRVAAEIKGKLLETTIDSKSLLDEVLEVDFATIESRYRLLFKRQKVSENIREWRLIEGLDDIEDVCLAIHTVDALDLCIKLLEENKTLSENIKKVKTESLKKVGTELYFILNNELVKYPLKKVEYRDGVWTYGFLISKAPTLMDKDKWEYREESKCFETEEELFNNLKTQCKNGTN